MDITCQYVLEMPSRAAARQAAVAATMAGFPPIKRAGRRLTFDAYAVPNLKRLLLLTASAAQGLTAANGGETR